MTGFLGFGADQTGALQGDNATGPARVDRARAVAFHCPSIVSGVYSSCAQTGLPCVLWKTPDVTPQFQAAGAALEAGDEMQAALALWCEHQERTWPVELALQATLQMSGTDTAVPAERVGRCHQSSGTMSMMSVAALEEAGRRANEIEQHKLNQRVAAERNRESVQRAREIERGAQAEQAKVDLDLSGCCGDDY
jgi:hypothetical protein